MNKQGPPSYDQSQGMESYNPTFPNAGQIGFQAPTNPNFEKSPSAPYPNAGQLYPGAGQPYPGAGQPYPGAGQPYPGAGSPYPGAGQPYPNAGQYPAGGQGYPPGGQPYPMEAQATPVYVAGVQNTGSSVHMVAPTVPVILAGQQQLGPHSTTVFCPTCKEHVTTKTKKESGTLAWLSCGTLLLVGCWLGCCLIPFYIDACQDVYHSCPKCKTFFGRYSRLN